MENTAEITATATTTATTQRTRMSSEDWEAFNLALAAAKTLAKTAVRENGEYPGLASLYSEWLAQIEKAKEILIYM